MIKTKKLFVLVFLLLNCILFSACSQSKEVDFVKKYKIDLNTVSDVTEVLQKAIDELPDDGVLFLQDGTYPLAGRIVFKENMTFKLSDNAILLNCSQDKNPMMAYNHPYKHNKAEGNSNIIIEGGIWDMNGQLDESGTPKNLPNAESINALGIGYGSNITIRNITFRDCYNGHVIQVAGSDNVLIENCRFEGQSFRGSGDKTRELLQIEPGTVKGYPYTLVQNKAPSTNVTIRNCYFGGSENTPHYMAAIGTHSQQAGVKCSDIVIEDCTFDNAAYTAIHFMAYDRITIRNNIFTITSDSEQIDRYGILADTYGSFIDPTGAESTTDFTIEGNTFAPQFGQIPIILFFISAFTPFFISVFFTSSVIIVLISVINSLGSISPRSIRSSFVSQSAVISGDWISSGITVMRALPLSVGSSTLVFLLPFRSRKPFCTSFSIVAARVAGVPMP